MWPDLVCEEAKVMADESMRDEWKKCSCSNLKNPWFKHVSKEVHRPAKVVAYVRTDAPEPALERQVQTIDGYCRENNFELVRVFKDDGPAPGMGLSDALNSLSAVDGLIAVDLERFVQHHDDRVMDLRPLLHQFFCTNKKYLITISEGINTSSAEGQKTAMQYIASEKENF